MKKSIIIQAAAVLLILSAAPYFIFSDSPVYEGPPSPAAEVFIQPRENITIKSPYSGADWDNHEQHRANLHAHTLNSDGTLSPARIVEIYRDLGYAILAITDHNYVTWPWDKYGISTDEQDMTAIQGNEISDTHHIGSYFNDYNVNGKQYHPLIGGIEKTAIEITEDEVLRRIADKGGLAVFFHPGRYNYPAEYYINFYERFDHLIGLEVINQLDRYPLDREKWDEILTALMPERPVWGFSNDDTHLMKHIGRCYNVFILSELSEEKVREAMISGRFYFCNGQNPPVIERVETDNGSGRIRIKARNYDLITWISDGRHIHRGKTLEFRKTANIGSYIRAEIHGPGGITYTNPFSVIDPE